MGADFIRSQASSHTKSWSAEYQRAAEDLFSQHSASYGRSFLATVRSECPIHEGDFVHVRLLDNQVLVLRDLSLIAEIDKPTLDLKESLDASYGIVDGYIEELNPFTNVISVHIGRDLTDDSKI